MDDAKLFINLISSLGALGFIFWLVRRTTIHTIPRLAESFEKSLSDARKDYRESATDARTDFLEAIREQREQYSQIAELERNHQRMQTDKIVESLRDIKDEIKSR